MLETATFLRHSAAHRSERSSHLRHISLPPPEPGNYPQLSSPRTACVFLPHLFVQLALRRRPELAGRPVVVGGAAQGRQVVLDASPEAHAAGVSPGMPLRQLAGLCPDAAVLPYDTSLTGEVLFFLRQVMESFSPVVEPEGADALYLDIGGVDLSTLGRDGPPGEAALLQALLDDVARTAGLRACAGVGAGKFVARAAAALASEGYGHSGHGNVRVVAPGEEREALADVPVGVLPCSAEMRRRLHLFGLYTLGDLAALPFGPVQAQFGREGARLWRLITGDEVERPVDRAERPAPAERLDLPAPTADRDALAQAAGLLLRRLFRRPEVGSRVARGLVLSVTLEDGSCWERALTFREPTADADRALFAVRTRLEGLELPAAAVSVAATLIDLCGERGRQADLFSARGHRLGQLEEMIHHLRSRLGTNPILRVVEVEPWSRIPERRSALMEYLP